MKKLLQNPLVIITLLAFVLVYIWFKEGYQIGGAEGGLPFNNLANHEQIMRYAWAYPALGNATSINVASWPTYYFFSLFEKAGIPGFITESAFFLIIFLISGYSVYLLTRELIPKLPDTCILISVFYYWFNPFSWVAVWNRMLFNFMLFWAILPLILWLFLRGLRLRDYRYGLIISLASAVFALGLVSVVFNFILWGLIIYTILFFLIINHKDFEFLIKYFSITLISFVLVNFWWISQLFNYASSSPAQAVTSSFVSESVNIRILTELSERLGVLVYLIRMLHKDFFASELHGFNSFVMSPLIVLIQLLTVSIVFLVIVLKRNHRSVLFLGSLFIFTLFLSKGNSQPLGELFNFVYSRIYVLQVFRNPFEKFGFLLPLAISPLFGFGTYVVAEKFKTSSVKRLIVYSVSAVTIVIFSYPFFSRIVLTYEEKDGRLNSYHVQVPENYELTDNWFDQKNKESRFISLPILDEGISYDWHIPYSGIDLSSTLFKSSNISFNTTIPYYTEFVKQISESQLNSNIVNFLPFSNSKYILLRKDINFKTRRMANPEKLKKNLLDIEKSDRLTKKYESSELEIYEVNDRFFWPKIYFTGIIYAMNQTKISSIPDISSKFPDQKLAILNNNQENERMHIEKNIIFPTEVILQSVKYPLPKSLSDEDLLSRLFYVQHMPNKWYYPVVRFKEKLEEYSENNYYGWLIYKNGILGKRAAEIYKLRKNGFDEVIINKAEKDYKSEFNFFISNINDVIEADLPISDLIRKSLFYHLILFERSNSPLSKYIDDYLRSKGIKPRFELPVSSHDYIIYNLEIPKESLYQIKSAEEITTDNYFIDGKEKNLEVEGISELNLSYGNHELAIAFDERTNLLSRVKESNFRLSELNKKEWEINIPDKPTTFIIEFEYNIKPENAFEIQFRQDNDFVDKPGFSRQILYKDNENSWKYWHSEVTTTAGADLGFISFRETSVKKCFRIINMDLNCKYHSPGFDAEIRNLKISEIRIPEFYLLTEGENRILESSKVSFVRINPTLYELIINKRNSESEFLVFSELFNNQWKAKYNDGTSVSDENHFLVNGFANGWLIDKPGNYSMTLEFTPQSILDKSKGVSLISFVAGLTLLSLSAWYRKKLKN